MIYSKVFKSFLFLLLKGPKLNDKIDLVINFVGLVIISHLYLLYVIVSKLFTISLADMGLSKYHFVPIVVLLIFLIFKYFNKRRIRKLVREVFTSTNYLESIFVILFFVIVPFVFIAIL